MILRPMKTANIIRLEAPGVRSLLWSGDTLIDPLGAATRYGLDGTVERGNVAFGGPFDAAIALPDSAFLAIYTQGGTKALILQGRTLLREINRSYYCADDYDYPITLFRLPSGRPVIAHCPDEYNELQIDDLETGEPLTRLPGRKARDFFHSRLTASPDGRFLASAGWVWHPWDAVAVFDVEAALRDPNSLDGGGLDISADAEESSATFLPDGRLAVALFQTEIPEDDTPPAFSELKLFDLRGQGASTETRTPGRVGQIVPVDEHHVLALYQHPRLIDLRDGQVVGSWPEIASGDRTSPIFGASSPTPPMAFDPGNRRYAFADDEGITVLQIPPREV